MDVEKFVRHLCRLVLRHQMPVWNYFVNSFYSVGAEQSAPKDRRKFPEYRRPQIFGQSADILTSRAGTTAGTVRERRRPYKLGGLSAQVT